VLSCSKAWSAPTLAAMLCVAAAAACGSLPREPPTELHRHAADPRPVPNAGAAGSGAGSRPESDAGAAGAAEPETDPRFATRLDTAADFARLQGEQWSVKYLARIDGQEPPEPLDRDCTFQDTATYPLHLHFLRTFPEFETLDFDTYLTLVVHRASRVLWGGELRLFSGARHPRTGQRGVMGLFVYADAEEPLETEKLVEIYRRIEGCAPYARDMLVLVGADTEQAERFRAQAEDLDGFAISVVDHVDLAPSVAAEAYSVGDGYGYLRIVPSGQPLPSDLGRRDLLVIEGASDDIGLVAGLVTALPQNIHSHLNLRLREKGIPNARISDIFEDQALMDLDGRLAHLHVEDDTAALEPALLVDAETFWSLRVPPITLPTPDLDQKSLMSVAHLSASDVIAYGSKATNLGELYSVLPKANRLTGFGIPFSRYSEWMQQSGLADRVTELLSDPRTRTDAVYRRSELEALREAIEDAEIPKDFVSELAETAEAVLGSKYETLPLKFRSSSNVEDTTRLSGAGLHGSARGCFEDDFDGDTEGPSACLSDDERAALQAELDRRRTELAEHPERTWVADIVKDLSSDLTKERSVARAIKKVYASLWNDRAFEERAYFGIDQRTARMGILVNPSFVLEKVDAVAVTNLFDANGEPYNRVVSQVDGQPVVDPPDPTAAAETLTFRTSSDGTVRDVEVLTSSSLSPSPIWSKARLQELADLLSVAQTHFETDVYPEIQPFELDCEIKVTRDDRIVIKQARPYVSSGP
jgi:pyruvate,water dikinase